MKYLLVFLLAGLLPQLVCSGRPNIVLVMADDQGWGDMGYNGHPVLQTPNFDRFAEEGIRFDRFYAAAPVCSPTRASVLTGRHPNRMGVFKWGHPIRPQERTIAEMLKTAGYVTGHFGKWHLGSVQVASPVHPGACGFDEWLSAPNFFENDPILSREGRAVQMRGESSVVTAEAALEFLKKHAKREAPLFAVVWFGSPHQPHVAADEDLALYPDAPPKKAHFYGEITGMDRALGRLREGIAELGMRDNTILWYCSDNGGLMPESTGGRARKGSVYEGGLRVPSMLEWPARFTKPRVVKAPCVTSDILPTVLDLTEVEVDSMPRLDGVSIAGVISGSFEKRLRPIGFWDYASKGRGVPSAKWMRELLDAQATGTEPDAEDRLRKDAGVIAKGFPLDAFPGHSAWLHWPWKLHRIERKAREGKSNVKWELYDLSADPMETQSLVTSEVDRVMKMRASLEQWLASVTRSLNGSDYQSSAP